MSSWTNMFIDISWRDGYVNGFHEAESWQISDSQILNHFQVPTSNLVPTSKFQWFQRTNWVGIWKHFWVGFLELGTWKVIENLRSDKVRQTAFTLIHIAVSPWLSRKPNNTYVQKLQDFNPFEETDLHDRLDGYGLTSCTSCDLEVSPSQSKFLARPPTTTSPHPTPLPSLLVSRLTLLVRQPGALAVGHI